MKWCCLLACLAAAVALAAEPDADRARALVKLLGADTFKEREAAQKELSAMSRSVLPVLREFENTRDPEIKDRLQAAIHAILTDTSRIPQKVHLYRDAQPVITITGRKDWAEHFAQWMTLSKISVCQTNGRAATSGHFAQSFVPHSRQLRAIAVQAYPISNADGWLSLDLRADKDGNPDNTVLARSWLRLEKRCAPHSSFAVFTLPDTALESEKPYWFIVVEHRDGDQPNRSLTNHRFDPQGATAEMRMLDRQGCANFFLLTDGPLPSWLREATEDERKNLPTPPASIFEWWNQGEPNAIPTENDG